MAIDGCLAVDLEQRIPGCVTLREVLEGRRDWRLPAIAPTMATTLADSERAEPEPQDGRPVPETSPRPTLLAPASAPVVSRSVAPSGGLPHAAKIVPTRDIFEPPASPEFVSLTNEATVPPEEVAAPSWRPGSRSRIGLAALAAGLVGAIAWGVSSLSTGGDPTAAHTENSEEPDEEGLAKPESFEAIAVEPGAAPSPRPPAEQPLVSAPSQEHEPLRGAASRVVPSRPVTASPVPEEDGTPPSGEPTASTSAQPLEEPSPVDEPLPVVSEQDALAQVDEPAVEPEPMPPPSEPLLEPESEPAQPLFGMVRVTGDASEVHLVGGERPLPPGPIPPGSYTVVANLGGRLITAGKVEVLPGTEITLHCSVKFARCSVK
jgi:hypothetical protein